MFFLLSSLAGWLIRKIGKRFDPLHEFDDPNSTIAYSGSFVPTSGYHWHFSYQVLMGSFYFEQGPRKYCLGKFWRRGGKNYTIYIEKRIRQAWRNPGKQQKCRCMEIRSWKGYSTIIGNICSLILQMTVQNNARD